MNFFEYDCYSHYPKDYYYRPSESYPEYPFKEQGLSEENNDVYRMIRNLFYDLELDKKNYGKPDWNPLGVYIVPGDIVLVKPNLVHHHNPLNPVNHNGLECMVTHPSVIRCILDYVIIALQGKGKIVIGDAPVQECIFERLLDVGGYRRIEKFYEQITGIPYNIQFVDFRHSVMKVYDDVNSQRDRQNIKYGSQIVDIGKMSLFYGKNTKKLRITNFDAKETMRGHTGKTQMYCISDACLQADVIINLPKPKTHRLAGMTGALKNMIGVNARKEYLPHYTMGSKKEGGDAYPYKDKYRKLQYKLLDMRNRSYKKKQDIRALNITKKAHLLDKYKNKKNDSIEFGAWRGNDTIWRTVLDVNYAITYAGKNGKITNCKQRKMLSIGDMIVCGENEGPTMPDYKVVGGILFADDPVEFDLFLCELMGFEFKKIPMLKYALQNREVSSIYFKSNDPRYCGQRIERKNSFTFLAQKGWRGFIEKRE